MGHFKIGTTGGRKKHGHSFALNIYENPIQEHPIQEHPIQEHPIQEHPITGSSPEDVFRVVPTHSGGGIGVKPILLGNKKWEKPQHFPLFMKYPARRKASGPERMVLWVSP